MVQDRVGGYLDYLALLEHARDYDDVLVVLHAEAEAAKIRAMQEQARG